MEQDYERRTKAELIAELKALHAAVSFFVFDRDGMVRDANETGAAMLGLEREALLGRSFLEYCATEADAARFLDHAATVLESGRRSAAELELKAGAGALHARLESVPTDGTHPFPQSIHTTVVDITERKHLEEQLQHAQRMEAMGRLAGGIAHDFNNILMAIMGHTEILLVRLNRQDPVRANIEVIQKTIERAASLTQQLVAFSRKQIIAPKVINLNEVIVMMESMLRRLIGEDVELVCVLPNNVGSVKVDPGQIEQVIMNLTVNARDAMPQGGTVTVETANVTLDAGYAARHLSVQPGPYVRLTATDTGSGMDAATQRRIFEPFFTTKEPGKGTGLGLSTVYGIVKQSGGHIDVESAPGLGARFSIYLPRIDEAPEVLERDARVADMPRGSETILVVEDEDMVRGPICEMLRLCGYTVVEARHGGEALLICERHKGPIHLMLTDVVMPQISGRELAQRVAPLRPDMKVLFMSGHTDDTVIRHGVMNALFSLLTKPFTPEALARKVRAVLDGHVK